MALIPIFCLLDGSNSTNWYDLYRKSSRNATTRGAVELEISCSGQPDSEQASWVLFHEVQKLPELALSLVPREAMTVDVKTDTAESPPPYSPSSSTYGEESFVAAAAAQAALLSDGACVCMPL